MIDRDPPTTFNPPALSLKSEAEAEASAAVAEQYALVEIFGHIRHWGRVSEVEQFGQKMMRIDIPMTGKFSDGYETKFYGGASIFSFTPCDLALVERANARQPAGLICLETDDDEPEFDDAET